MAINRDAAEWFERRDRMEDVIYGVLKAKDDWLVLKKWTWFKDTEVTVLARADTREAAIGFIKLLVEKRNEYIYSQQRRYSDSDEGRTCGDAGARLLHPVL